MVASSGERRKIPVQDYLSSGTPLPVYRARIQSQSTPIDINIQFIIEDGWNQTDRLRFHTETKDLCSRDHPMAQVIGMVKPHMLLRRYNIEEDFFITVSIFMDGTMEILSNNEEQAKRYLADLLLGFPPAFYTAESYTFIEEGWTEDGTINAMFLGLLAGASGWDPMLQIPPAIKQSLEEAGRALSIANYRSCVVMCRRTIEALIKFAFRRLLGAEPVDNRGRTLSLDRMIDKFGEQQPLTIPQHLLHLLDSVRLIGNVPGAHAAEIERYPFTKSDAEYTLASVHYFLEQYFSKIDKEVGTYYTLTIDLDEDADSV